MEEIMPAKGTKKISEAMQLLVIATYNLLALPDDPRCIEAQEYFLNLVREEEENGSL
jgi:hypothetical protein